MENVVLIIHLLLALGLIAVVLLQRSEGGGLGSAGGGGGGGAVSGRAAATALSKLTWVLAAAFICTSIVLTVVSAQKAGNSSVFDNGLLPPSTTPAADAPVTPLGNDLLPPSAGDNAPLVPSAD